MDIVSENIRTLRRKGRKGTQEFFTPDFIIDRMINKIDNRIWGDPNIKFFEPSFGNGNIILKVLKKKIENNIDWKTSLSSIYGIELMPDNVQECKERIINYLKSNFTLSPEDEYEASKIIDKNLLCGDFLNIIIDEYYDIIIMNPPYNAGLGEKFLEKCIEVGDRIITIQPYTWFVGLRQNNSLLNKIRNKYLEYDKDNIIQNAFLDSVGDPIIVAIFYIDKLKETKIIINNEGHFVELKEWPERIYRFIGIDYFEEFDKRIYSEYTKDNVDNHIENFEKQNISDLNNDYIIKIPRIRGHLGKLDIYTIFPNDNNYIKNNSGELSNIIDKCKIKRYIKFKNEIELNGFINYSKTYFCRAALSLSKICFGVADCKGCSRIPWFDFKEEIFQHNFQEIDKYLFDKFELNHIKNNICEYLGEFYYKKDEN